MVAPQVDAAVDPIVAAFTAVQERLEDEYARILTDPNAESRRRRIRSVSTMISRETAALDTTTGRWVADQVPAIYAAGARQATELDYVFNQFHRTAVEILQTDVYDDVATSLQNMRSDTRRWIRDTSRLIAAEGHIEGVAPRELARRFSRLAPKALDAQGLPMPITAVTYGDGSVRTIDAYADMLFRTKGQNTFNAGTINRSRELGISRFEIRDGPGCKLRGHGDPGPDDAHGKIVDAETAAAYPISHPNCRRVYIARPDLDDDSPVEPVPEGIPPGPVPLPDLPNTPARQPRSTRRARQARTPKQPRDPKALVVDSVSKRETATIERLRNAGNTEDQAREVWQAAVRRLNRDRRLTDKTADQLRADFDAAIAEALQPRVGAARFGKVDITRVYTDPAVRTESLRRLDELADEFRMIDIDIVGSGQTAGLSMGRALGQAAAEVRTVESKTDPAFVDLVLARPRLAVRRIDQAKLDRSKSAGFNSTADPAHVIVHEFGHFIDYKLRERAAVAVTNAEARAIATTDQVITRLFEEATGRRWADARRQIAEEISDYAATSPSETFAEAFAMVRLTPDEAPDIAKRLVEHVTARIKDNP